MASLSARWPSHGSRAAPGAVADGPFPTLGYQDLTEPFPASHGSIPTDFREPVDPSIDITGLDMAGISALYATSGGGAERRARASAPASA